MILFQRIKSISILLILNKIELELNEVNNSTYL